MSTGDVILQRDYLRKARLYTRSKMAKHYISLALDLTYRTSSGKAKGKPGPVVKITAELRDAVKEYVAKHPRMRNRNVARQFRLGEGGRVTEILQGMYDGLKYDA